MATAADIAYANKKIDQYVRIAGMFRGRSWSPLWERVIGRIVNQTGDEETIQK
jgi:hypothetical protein